MKERIIVMNGTKILEREVQGKWEAGKVEPAGTLKPGIYNIYNSRQPEPNKAHEGAIIHADKESVYQQVGKEFVVHPRKNFDKVPVIGSYKSITQGAGKAVVADAVKQARGLSR